MSDDHPVAELAQKISNVCADYQVIEVMSAALCIAEAAIKLIDLNDPNPAKALGHRLTAERLEYLAKIMRGKNPPDPHENMPEIYQLMETKDDETTH